MSQTPIPAPSMPKLLTVKQFAAAYPWLTEKALRAMIFRANEIGFTKCVRRIRKKVLLDVAAVAEWIERENDTAGKSWEE